MELKFVRKPLQCLRPFFGQVHTQEQIQEIRLPDAYPDIGRILGCWGKVLIRGKEWRSTAMAANGGVMAWVMYAPEDGTQSRIVDVWIPIQCRWDFPDAMEDGSMTLLPVLTNLDARGVSARKIIVRCGVDTFAQAMSRATLELAEVAEIPEDIQLMRKYYPVELPVEAGEKQVQLEELLSIPENLPPIHKIVHYDMMPTVSEQKVLSNRLVFKGQMLVKLAYMTEEGTIHDWETELPFSQYAELDRDHSSNATAWVMPLMTAMEIEMDEMNQMQLRAGLAAQYTIFDRAIVDVIEDAYSPRRSVTPKIEQLQLPSLLDSAQLELIAQAPLQDDINQILMVTPYSKYPSVRFDGDSRITKLEGQMQLLLHNEEGQMYSDSAAFDATVPFPSAAENQVSLWLGMPTKPEIIPGTDGATLRSTFPASAQIYNGQSLAMVTELEIGEQYPEDPDRPSIILRRVGQEDLWTLAKRAGSTVAAIRQANQLEDEPEDGQMLLIPLG